MSINSWPTLKRKCNNRYLLRIQKIKATRSYTHKLNACDKELYKKLATPWYTINVHRMNLVNTQIQTFQNKQNSDCDRIKKISLEI